MTHTLLQRLSARAFDKHPSTLGIFMKISDSDDEDLFPKERVPELQKAVEDFKAEAFSSLAEIVQIVYPSWMMYASYLPAWHMARFFLNGKKTPIYPIAYQVVITFGSDVKKSTVHDVKMEPYIWMTRDKQLVLPYQNRFFFVKVDMIREWMSATHVERLLLSLKGDEKALEAIYIEEGVRILGANQSEK